VAVEGPSEPAPSALNRVTFSIAWLVFFVVYLFTLPRTSGPLPTSLALLMLGITIYSLFVLGRRFPPVRLFPGCLDLQPFQRRKAAPVVTPNERKRP
jgi:hypothetical protein